MTSKRRMPAKLRQKAQVATARHQARPIAPDVQITADEGKWSYGNPYQAADERAWCALMFEAFGTRQRDVANVFVNHLARLCSTQWDETAQAWRPNENELQTAIALVQSLAPRNEAEAALAAQAVAIHFATMKLAHHVAGRSNPDARTLASLAALAKAYVKQLEAMQQLKGRKVSRQKITVRNERHVHHHQHVHAAGDARNLGGQSHATNSFVECTPMPGKGSLGSVVPFSGAEGQARLSNARRPKRGAER
ncbi:hypothetical protein [Sphingomonas sp. RB1R13]|uniref:hypothetical protein n=1 Tax=Sphingomonas sp. RB1R13 TaxID=3096159 RepID=UPI002FCAD841